MSQLPNNRLTSSTLLLLFFLSVTSLCYSSPSFDLNTINGTNGFIIDGQYPGETMGFSVSTAGDVNGDGIGDLVIGAPAGSPNAIEQAGRVYVLFGKTTWPRRVNVTTLDGKNGFVVDGLMTKDWLGVSVDTAGDVNGDDVDDLVLGACYSFVDGYTSTGKTYVLFGKKNDWPAKVDLTTLSGHDGFVMYGVNYGDRFGVSVSTAGDFNGDQISEIVIGAYQANSSGVDDAGMVYIIYGQKNWPSVFNLTTLNGQNGFIVNGPQSLAELGYAVNAAGDINADGKDDVVLGAYEICKAYVIFGSSEKFPVRFNLSHLNGVNGFVTDGVLSDQDWLGVSVDSAGDVNGDGVNDLVLGAQHASHNDLTYSGRAYVLFGKSEGWPPAYDLTSINGSNGFAVDGIVASDQLGFYVSTAGDIDDDGFADLLISAVPPTGTNKPGEVYVVFGRALGWSEFNLTNLNGKNGYIIKGLDVNDKFGNTVSNGGDVNGDGIDDYIIGAPYVAPAGAAYVIFGVKVVHQPPVATMTVPDHEISVGQPFSFTIDYRHVFNVADEDHPLMFYVTANGTQFPWIQFDGHDPFRLTFSGNPNAPGKTLLTLFVKNPWNQGAKTEFYLSAVESPSTVFPWAVLLFCLLVLAVVLGMGYALYLGRNSGKENYEKINDATNKEHRPY